MNRGITKENLLFILPPALTHDKSIVALAETGAEALEARPAEIDRARVISNIDGLDEAVLDILAQDFKVDWWDLQYSIEEKRQTLKDSWRVHKILGTKAAVETAIRAIYPNTTVEEWFEYGGEPYHFRLNINITSDSGDMARQKRVLERMNFCKSLRSHNDGVTYFVEAAPAVTKAVVYVPRIREELHTSLEIPVPTIQAKASVRTGIATVPWETFTVGIALPEPEPPKSTAKLRTGISGAWQESYTTGEITLPEKELSTIGQAGTGGAVVSTQETATTHIQLS